MPFELILTALGTTSLTVIILVVLGLLVGQKLIEQSAESAARRYESRLIQVEEAFKQAIDVSSQIDVHLREQRIQVYGKLWNTFIILPRWPRAANVTYQDLCEFSETLRSWYFADCGGMWISSATRKAYGNLQDEIWKILPKHPDGPISTEHYDRVLDKCSLLRTELTNDLLSRRAAPVNPEVK